MTVWAVWNDVPYEGLTLLSIHATRAGAEAAFARYRKQRSYGRLRYCKEELDIEALEVLP